LPRHQQDPQGGADPVRTWGREPLDVGGDGGACRGNGVDLIGLAARSTRCPFRGPDIANGQARVLEDPGNDSAIGASPSIAISKRPSPRRCIQANARLIPVGEVGNIAESITRPVSAASTA